MLGAAINLRALPEQHDLIVQAAHLLGKNRSDFMLEAACERAQSVLPDQFFSAWTRINSSNMPDPVPVMVLGRLAVDRRVQRIKLGAAMLKDAVNRASAVS